MGRIPGPQAQIVSEALRRFPHLPSRTIAQYILANQGVAFENNLEKIRTHVRYQRGSHGEADRQKRKISEKGPIYALPETWCRARPPFHLDPGLWLVIADLHIPFHVKMAIYAALKYGKSRKVTGILIDGDAQDYAAISFWAATMRPNFDKEIDLFIDFLDYLQQEFPNVQIVFKPGNHEYRLPRLYQAKVPQMTGLPLAAMDTVLGLEWRGIEFLDYHQVVYAGKLPILHGHEIKASATTVNPARGLFLKTKMYAMCAHHHRTSENTETNLQGQLLTTWSIGCLCDLSPDYIPYGNNWNHGFALINVGKNGMFEVENKRILPNGDVV